MRIPIITSGTRGDVQPALVLALELEARGHDVVLGVPPNLLDLVTRAGVAALPFGPDTQRFMESPEGRGWLASGDVRAFTAALNAVAHEHIEQTDAELLAATEGADVVVAGILAEDHAACVAEAAGVPLVALHSAPLRRTRAYPAPLVTTRPLPGPLARATGALFEAVWWRGARPDVSALRAQLGLPPTRRSTPARLAAAGAPELQVYSGVLVPGLADYGPRRPLVGFLHPTPELRSRTGETGVDPDLDRWLADGPPPVYVGFGSMPVTDPAAAVGMVDRVTARRGLRALVSAGWGRLAATEGLGDQVRVVGALDHDAVLPRCRVAVHHGGAGTTAAAVLAGVPSLVCSVFADQPFWGTRVERLGAGAHVRFAALDEAALDEGLGRALDPAAARRAAALGAALRAEPAAAARAADEVEAAAERSRRRVA